MLRSMNAAPRKKPHYIKEWRLHRGLSLRRLADRLTDPVTFERLISDASLSRIENGKQDYTQEVLEALADAFGCEPADLLMRNPLDPEGIWSIWDTLEPAQRKQAVEVVKALKLAS